MKGFELLLVLEDDCVFSERSATEGGHRGLSYVPGAALLGAAAAQLYGSLSPEDAFTLFHSGQVRFGNGLPLDPRGDVGRPLPLCWHRAKGVDPVEGGQLIGERVWRFGLDESPQALPDGLQPVQMREGYVTDRGGWLEPTESLRMKTAIDPATGRAREAALFGYESLAAGQRFAASVTADDAVADSLLDQLRRALSGRVLLGRSRSGEYGRVQVEATERAAAPTKAGANEHRTATLWLLSDLAAFDNWGQPTLVPEPQWLGLPKGELVMSKSFIRSRRYSPWNSHRGGPDLERQVIVQGSVLVFELEAPLAAEHRALLEAGIGAYREAGLGQVSLNPPLIAHVHPRIAPSPDGNQAPLPEAPRVTRVSPLIEYLQRRDGAQARRQSAGGQARDLARGYRDLLASARRLGGRGEKDVVGPSASQWGAVLAAAKSAGADELRGRLFDRRDGVCKATAPGWVDEHWDAESGRTRSFSRWLHDVLEQTPEPRFLQLLAREVMDVVRKEVRS